MRPLLFQNEAITVGAYPFCYGLGLVCGGLIFGLLLRQRVCRFRDAINLWAIICVLSYLGGMLLYVVIDLPSQRKLSSAWLSSLTESGQVLYGGLICGTIGGWYACRRLELPLREALDASGVAAPIGIAVGRVGCLLKGCCHGTSCSGWWAIRYPRVTDIYGNLIGSVPYLEELQAHQVQPSDAWSLPLHPVPVYESIACLCMASVLYTMWRRKALTGRLVFVFGATYAAWRFTVEFVRVHERVLGLLTVYQLISIGVLTACVAVCLLWKPTDQPAVVLPSSRSSSVHSSRSANARNG